MKATIKHLEHNFTADLEADAKAKRIKERDEFSETDNSKDA